MAKPNEAALKLPDSLLVRYFRAGEIDQVKGVTITKDQVRVKLTLDAGTREDRWRDLGGGLGYVPDAED